MGNAHAGASPSAHAPRRRTSPNPHLRVPVPVPVRVAVRVRVPRGALPGIPTSEGKVWLNGLLLPRELRRAVETPYADGDEDGDAQVRVWGVAPWRFDPLVCRGDVKVVPCERFGYCEPGRGLLRSRAMRKATSRIAVVLMLAVGWATPARAQGVGVDFDLLVTERAHRRWLGQSLVRGRRRHPAGPGGGGGQAHRAQGDPRDRRQRAGGRARLRRHAQPLGQQPAGRRRRLQHDLPGGDLGDPGRGRLGRAQQAVPHLPRLLRQAAARAAPRSTSAPTSGRRRSGPSVRGERGGPPTKAELEAHARRRPPGDGRRRAGRGQLAVGSARLLDRHRHAGGHVRGGGPRRRHLLDPHAPRGRRRVQGGPGGDGDRPPGQGAGRHHPHQDLRAHPVGPDAQADRRWSPARGPRAPSSRPTSTPTRPARTTSAPSCRPGRTRAARRRWWRA